MKVLLAVVLAAIVAAVLAFETVPEHAIVSENPLTEASMQRLWKKFKSTHEKIYGAVEHDKRFQIFKQNIEKARIFNLMSNATTYGITKFSDLTSEEFRSTYLSKSIHTPEMANSYDRIKVRAKDVPTAWDWRDHGAVTPVKNQGSCGSCWSFSTTGNVEGQWAIKTKQLVSLSEQQLVDCDHECDPKSPSDCDAGCGGGLMSNAFTYIIKNKGIDSEQSYPYEGIDDKCRFKPQNVAANISSWLMLPTDEEQIKAWLYQNGPVAVALNAGWLQFYVGGISDPLVCNPKSLDHGVLIVGFGVGKTWVGKEVQYWIVKNSWGSGWGEKGYFRMILGKGKCGINTFACSSRI